MFTDPNIKMRAHGSVTTGSLKPKIYGCKTRD